MQSEDRTIYLDLLRKLRGMNASVASGVFRQPSRSEQEQQPRKPGYYAFFCIHAKHRWSICKQCGRSKAKADAIREAYLDEVVKLVTK